MENEILAVADDFDLAASETEFTRSVYDLTASSLKASLKLLDSLFAAIAFNVSFITAVILSRLNS